MPRVLITEPALAGLVEPLRAALPGVDVAVVTGFDDE